MGDTKMLDGLRAPRCLTPEGALEAWKVAHAPIKALPAEPVSTAEKPGAPAPSSKPGPVASMAPGAPPSAPAVHLHAAFGLGPRRPLRF
jgi:hypothetical protein